MEKDAAGSFVPTKGQSRVFFDGTEENKAATNACLAYIETVFADRPDLKKLVTPEYPFGGKRPVKDSRFYPTLLRDNVG